jgi:DNA modification methylase
MNEMITYFLKMITPPVEDAYVLVSDPDEIDFNIYTEEIGSEDSLTSTFEPMLHGLILLGEPTSEQADQIMRIMKPGAHVVLIPKSDSPIGYKGVIAMEDIGFEVRDAIFVADGKSDFFYGSKAGRTEREAGCDNLSTQATPSAHEGEAVEEGEEPAINRRKNNHPTVKPINVMEWCARDISPKSKVVDPFLGSGTTGCAMARLGHDFVGIELQPEYAKICDARIRYWSPIGTEIKSEAQLEEKGEKEHTGQVSLF